jgi:MT0933-like antitoxin protein
VLRVLRAAESAAPSLPARPGAAAGAGPVGDAPGRERRPAGGVGPRAAGYGAATGTNRKERGMVDLGGLADKAKNALNSEQGEQRSDQALDKAEQLADEKTGGKYDQQVDKGRDLADQRIGQEDAGQPPA